MSQNEFLRLFSYLDCDWYHTVSLNSITGFFLCKLTQLESSKVEYSILGKKMAQILRYVTHKDKQTDTSWNALRFIDFDVIKHWILFSFVANIENIRCSFRYVYILVLFRSKIKFIFMYNNASMKMRREQELLCQS